jgi:magnesium transporter
VDLADVEIAELHDRQLLWVDVDRHDDDAIVRSVAERLELSHADVERLAEETGRAKLIRTEDRLHLTLEALEADDEKPPQLTRREIDLVAAHNIVLSVHSGPVVALQRFIETLGGETRLGALTAADLLSSLVDEVLIGYYELSELIEREIDDLDQRALHGRRADDILSAIVSVRRRIGLVRRTLAPHRDALATFSRPEMRVEETVGQPWPGLADRLDGALVAVDGLRDSLLGTYDIHMGRVSQRANDVMKILTLLSAVLLPAVVLAGIMGMNFQMPFFGDTGNFFIVIASMGVLAAVILAIARWRDWL